MLASLAITLLSKIMLQKEQNIGYQDRYNSSTATSLLLLRASSLVRKLPAFCDGRHITVEPESAYISYISKKVIHHLS
jgi:hypothetical protein